MRSLIATIALAAVCATAVPTDYKAAFAQFKAKYDRSYKNEMEEAKRFGFFVENMQEAARQQARNPHATYGVTPFSDYSKVEMKKRHSAEKHYAAAVKQRDATKEVSPSAEEMKAAMGKAINWNEKGAVTNIKNQGQCGSCWAFSTTGGIEGQWFLAGNKLTSLSEQELVSCDTNDDGCNGGLMQNAFRWLLSAKDGKIVTEASYPYVSGNGNVPSCDCCSTRTFGAQITKYIDITKTESAMAAWVYANGPLSIAVDATSWETYTGGIMTDCSSVQLDHGVLIVGFNMEGKIPYWIIKNSWGPSWGEAGYIWVKYGSDECLLTSDPTSSVVGNSPHTSAPVTASPVTPSGMFKTLTCHTPDCTNCKETTFPQATCLPSGAFSFKATCGTDALVIQQFANADCSGGFNETSEDINVCNVNFGHNGLNSYTMNVCAGSAGPSPSPAPWTSSPSPVPSSTFTQKVCSNSACTSGCQSHTFDQNTCIPASGGGSIKAVCTATALDITEYPASSSCTGFSVSGTQPINTCTKDESGSYFENICSGSAGGIKGASIKLLKH